MVLNSTIFIGNFSNAFATGLIGSGGDIEMMLVGGILLLILVLCVFSLRMGLFGALVIIPPAIIILSTYDIIPYWISIVVSIALGVIVAWMFLSMVREG